MALMAIPEAAIGKRRYLGKITSIPGRQRRGPVLGRDAARGSLARGLPQNGALASTAARL